MKGTFKIQIGKGVNEKVLIETCLNYYFAEYDYKFLLFMYALACRWNVNKLTYYINLIEGETKK